MQRFRRLIHELRGFTLIEMLIVIGIITVVGSAAVPLTFRAYRTYIIRSERDSLVALLGQARTKAMVNANQNSHGVYIDANAFIGYEGANYATRVVSQDFPFTRSSSVTVTGAGEVTFIPVSGRANAATFELSNGQTELTITVTEEGNIDWE